MNSASGKRPSACSEPGSPGTVQGDARQMEGFAALEALNLPVSLITPQYTYRWVNSCYAAAHGKQPEEVIGRTVKDLWGETFDKDIKGKLDRSFEGAEARDEDWVSLSRAWFPLL